jgi:hypothetical protein
MSSAASISAVRYFAWVATLVGVSAVGPAMALAADPGTELLFRTSAGGQNERSVSKGGKADPSAENGVRGWEPQHKPLRTGDEFTTHGEPSLSLREVVTGPRFSATIDWVTTRVLTLEAAPRPGTGTNHASTFLLIGATKSNGTNISIYAWNATTNLVEYTKSLTVGRQYEFPRLFVDWARTNGAWSSLQTNLSSLRK